MKNTFRIIGIFLILFLILVISSCKKDKVPALTTSTITNILGTSATSGGTITNEGSSTILSKGVCWSTGTTPTISDNKTADGAGAASFTSNITGLNGATTYFVRAYATNSVGTGYGMAMSFTTLGQTPTPTSAAATNINVTTATLNGSVNANYLSTVVTFEYGTTTSYGSTTTATQSPLTGNSVTSISANITGLTPGTIYHYRVKAVNSIGTANGSDLTFTTLGQVPTVTILAETNMKATAITLNGTINANYLSTAVTFEYGTTTGYGNNISAIQSPVSGNTGTSVGANITGLTLNTTYHYRIKAVNLLGTTYSSDVAFSITFPNLLKNGLVAFYPFNGNANDESGAGLNGLVNSAILTTDRFGTTNSAYSFADNQDITVPNSQNKNLYPISISLWYNVSSILTGQNGNVFSKYISASWNGYQILVGDFRNIGNIGTTVNNGYGTASWYLRSLNDKVIGYYGETPFLQQNISFGTWYHYTFITDETGGRIYVNGQLIDSHPWTGTSGNCNNSYTWKIGGFFDGWFNGKIDEVRVYNRVLTQEEITYLSTH